MKTHLLIALVAISGALAYPPDARTALPADLIRVEQVEPLHVDYDNSLFIDPTRAGYLGDDKGLRTFRCGALVKLAWKPKTTYVVTDYRKLGEQWVYIIRPIQPANAQHIAP